MIVRFEQVNKDNLDIATAVQQRIFPDEHGDKEITQSAIEKYLDPLFLIRKSWLGLFENGEPAGIVGLYAYKEYPSDIWLDWFGILPEHRSKGYGSRLLKFAKQEAMKLGFDCLRLWTDDKDNEYAVAWYQKDGFILEIYSNPDDEHIQSGNTVILSIGLNGNTPEKWDNKNIYLKKFYHEVLGRKK